MINRYLKVAFLHQLIEFKTKITNVIDAIEIKFDQKIKTLFEH